MPDSGLVRRLPPVRGRLTANAPIGPLTWLHVGGPAEVLFRPADRDDLAGFLAALPKDVPVTVIGVGSNLLVRDGGIPGVTIRLGRGFVDIRPAGDTVETGARAPDLKVALTAAGAGIGGSTFANPPGHQAWRLIDEASCRGLTRGGAMVSEKHTNFLINTGNAIAADIEGLGEEVRRRVQERFGILLEWEIRRIGRPAAGAAPVAEGAFAAAARTGWGWVPAGGPL